MTTPPPKLRLVAESDQGPAAAEVRAESVSGAAASVLLEALAGNAQASVLIELAPDGKGGVSVTATEVRTGAETVTTRADAVRTSAITAQLAADKAGATLGDLLLQVSKVAKLAFASLKLSAVSALIAAERKLELRARTIQLSTSGGEIKADATRIELNAPQGQLGVGGMPIIVQTLAGQPYVMVQGTPSPVIGIKPAKWEAV